jgi:hypothetical protein
MTTFTLRWEIDVEADTPAEAVKEAQQVYRDMFKQGHTATHFDLCDEDGSIAYFDADSDESVEEAAKYLDQQ